MKMFKRLAAMLLAGAMAVAMLTACGGGTAAVKTDAQKAEEAYLAIYNGVFGTECQNDTGLQADAKSVLEKCVTDDGAFAPGTGSMMNIDTQPDENGNMRMVLIMSENNAPMAQTSELLNELSKEEVQQAVVASAKSEIIKLGMAEGLSQAEAEAAIERYGSVLNGMGVGTVQKGGKLYVAVVIRAMVRVA